jgi:hypothetical protein
VKKVAISKAMDQIKDWREDMWKYCDERNSKCTLANVFVGDGGIPKCMPRFYNCFIIIGATKNGSAVGDGYDYKYYLQCDAKCETGLWFPGRQPPDVGMDLINVAKARDPRVMAISAAITLIKWASFLLED